MKVARTPEVGSASSVLAWPAKTSPVEPSSDSQSPSFSVTRLAVHGDADFLLVLVDRERFRAGHAGRAHAAADHRRVAGHAAARRENALGHFHAVDIVGHGFFADQDHRRCLGLLDGVIGREHDGAHRRARRRRQTRRPVS